MKQIASVIPFAPKKRKEPEPLSKRQNQIINLAGDLAEQSREEACALGFMSRLLIMVNLPYRDPGNDKRVWIRENGNVSISITPSYDKKGKCLGLPYGTYPRLILAYLATQAVKTQSPEIYLGKNFGSFLKALNVHDGGKQYKLLQKQLQRTLGASFAWTYETDERWTRLNVQVASFADLWWNPKTPEQGSLWESYIKLNTDFFNEIVRNAVPLDLRVLATLKNSPLGLDLYMFIAWRTFKIDTPVFISWENLHGQLGTQHRELKEFTRECKKHIKRIQSICPTLKIAFPKGRLCLYPSYPL